MSTFNPEPRDACSIQCVYLYNGAFLKNIWCRNINRNIEIITAYHTHISHKYTWTHCRKVYTLSFGAFGLEQPPGVKFSVHQWSPILRLLSTEYTVHIHYAIHHLPIWKKDCFAFLFFEGITTLWKSNSCGFFFILLKVLHKIKR